MMPIKYYSSVTAVFILQIICSGKISTTASTTGLAEETAVSTYSSTTEYQQEIASAEITKNELQSISTVMTTTEDVSSSIGHSAKKQSQNLHSTEKTILISTESTTSKTISFKDQDATTQTKTTSAPERTSFETNQESTITAEQSNTMSTLSKAKLDITSALIQATFSTISDEQYGRSFLNQTSTSDRQSITPSLFQTTIRTNSKSDTPISDKQSITSETVTNNNNTSDTQTHTTVSIDQTSNGTSSLQPDSSPRFTKARETTIFKSLSNSFTTRDPTSDSSTSDKQSNSTQRFGITSSLQFDTTTTMSEAVDTMTTLIQSGRSTTIGQMSIATSSSVEKSSAPLMIKTSDRTMLQTQYYSKSTKIQTEDTTAILQRSRSTPPEVTSTGSPSETQTSYSNPSNPSTEVSYTADSTTGNTQYMVTSVYSTPLEVQSQVSTKETQTTHHFDKSSTKSQSSDSITLSKTSDSTSSQTKYDNNSTMIHTEGTTALFKVRESTPPDIQSPVSTKETQTTNHFDNSSPKSQSSNAIFLGGTSGGTLSQTKYHTKSAMIQTEGTTSLLPISGRSSPKIQSKSSTTETQTIDSSSQKSQSSNAVSIKTISKSTLPQTQFEGKSTIIQTEGTITLFQISDSTPPSYTSADSTLETRTSDSVSQKYQYSNAMTLNKISDSTLPQAQFDGTSTINQTEGTITLLQISGNTPSEVTSTVSTLETQTMNSNTSSEVYYTADSKTGKTQFMGTSISIDTTKQNTQSNLKAVSSIENTYMYGNTISVQQPTDSTPTVDNTPVTQSNDSVLSEIYGKSTTILRAADNTAQSERITAIDHTTESFISISNSQSNTLGNKKEYTTTIRTLNYSSPSLAPQFQETNRTPDIPLNYVTNVIQTSGRTTSQPELDTTTVLNTGNKISVTKYAKNTTETLTTENMTSATLSYRQNTLQTITQSPTDITDIQKNPLHRETTILNQPDTTPYSPDVTTEFLYSTTTQKVDHCNSFPCADGGICTSLSSTDSVCQCNSSKCGTYAENPCDNMENPPCVSDGVVHTCLLKTDGNFTCVCQKGYTNEGVYCIDIDECSANNYTCDVTYGVCNNTVGSYICSCSDGFVLGPGNTCTDRDGKWSDWESWSACTFTCGAGLQTRTRTCSSPSQAGFGDNCTLGHSLGTQTCNNVLCPATLDEQTYGVTIYLEGLTKDQLNSVETPFKQLVADIVNTYCNYNASNVQQCCQTSSSYSSNPSNPVTFTTSNNIAFGSGTPLEINNLLAVMIVIKYESNNALCRAALASVGRRRRSVILGELELALPQDIFEQIIANPDLQGNLTQSLVNAIDAQLGISLNITVSAVTLVTTTTTASSSTQGIVESNDTEPWVIGVAVVGAFLSLILIILGLALIFRLKMKTKVAPLQESNREEEDIN
ncbi:serine-rich adhesin for platelets-like isoform X4 [Mytilus trossulus]|uniref:serine-rich adhesin for platelets-like isoform X4 n=1 Tax=Mytilus trossulus TaxID=6551 RepID=UPI00300612D2